MRTGMQFNALDLTQDQSVIPTLLFHGINDTTALIVISDTFASRYETTSPVTVLLMRSTHSAGMRIPICTGLYCTHF